MAETNASNTGIRKLLYVLFAIQLTIIGAVVEPFWPLIVAGVVISLIVIISP